MLTIKHKILVIAVCMLITGLCASETKAQTSPVAMPSLLNDYPWTDSELIEPSVLAAMITKNPANMPVIFNIGAVEDIKGAKHIGAVSNAENMKTLKSNVSALPKNAAIVIYCGCCPFTKCPNIRPAFLELKKWGFTNVKLLNLPVNLKTNWISHGYPLSGSQDK
ncbi:MAG: hypothetical protein JWP29_5508 [Rhodoferax sp.]|jgi:hypothetical protein|nr:hypothetical protein [Rhodoferax sp.]